MTQTEPLDDSTQYYGKFGWLCVTCPSCGRSVLVYAEYPGTCKCGAELETGGER